MIAAEPREENDRRLAVTAHLGRETRGIGAGPVRTNRRILRILVVDGDLPAALKAWQRISGENRAALARHRWRVGPSERCRLKERKAAQRKRRRLNR
jgi:ribosomal protein S21